MQSLHITLYSIKIVINGCIHILCEKQLEDYFLTTKKRLFRHIMHPIAVTLPPRFLMLQVHLYLIRNTQLTNMAK